MTHTVHIKNLLSCLHLRVFNRMLLLTAFWHLHTCIYLRHVLLCSLKLVYFFHTFAEMRNSQRDEESLARHDRAVSCVMDT